MAHSNSLPVPAKLVEAIERFVRVQDGRTRSPQTLRAFRSDLAQLTAWLHQHMASISSFSEAYAPIINCSILAVQSIVLRFHTGGVDGGRCGLAWLKCHWLEKQVHSDDKSEVNLENGSWFIGEFPGVYIPATSKRRVAGSIPAWGTNTKIFNDSGPFSGFDSSALRVCCVKRSTRQT
jgi:hypothetical protein